MNAIEAAGISKRFGGLRAVDDVSLTVAAGERRVLIGPNGAGKTTLFACITGTLLPTSGRVALFGQDVTGLPESRRTALGMGRTFQISDVFTDLTLVENLILALIGTTSTKWTMRRAVSSYDDLRAQALAGLERVDLPRRGDDPVRLLSYGERRQLELALALACRPRVLLLDEPCAGLSPSERQRFVGLVEGLPRDVTMVMIEHDMDVALRLADRVTVLHHGRVILDGPPDRVRQDAEVREIYFGNA